MTDSNETISAHDNASAGDLASADVVSSSNARSGSVSVVRGGRELDDNRPRNGLSGESAAIFSMIERAARDPHVDIDKMERLFAMQQQAVDRNAKTAYLAAFSRMQSEMPAAARKGEGHNKKKYARFEDIVEALRPILAKHGFSLSHRVNTEGNQIKVTGILGHADGHSESTVMTLPPDTSGNKTPVHAMASAISYGKRYVSLTLTGIATDDDDDGKAAGAVVESADDRETKIARVKALIKETRADEVWMCSHHSVESIDDLAGAELTKALAGLEARKRKVSPNG